MQGQACLATLYESAAARAEERERRQSGDPSILSCGASAEPFGGVTVAAGENEDGVDDQLTLELSKQEELFQKCLRKRADRAEQQKIDKEARKAAAKKQKDDALEAAFDNDVDGLLALFDAGVQPECTDQHDNTLLSEASAGGAEDVVQLLLGEGCDPNSVGRYHRTPLWRAAYNGHAELIRVLLRSGADPRDCDAEGCRPIDVASNPPSKELLLCWDTSATDKIAAESASQRKAKAKNAEKEAKAKYRRQVDELGQGIEEASRKMQIARSEAARARKLLVDYRQQKVSFVHQGAADKLRELEPLLEGAEAKVKLFEKSIQEWEWKAARAKLKLNDFEQAEKEKAAKKAGKAQGFKVEVRCEDQDALDRLLPLMDAELTIHTDVEWDGGVELRRGDALIKDAPFAHLRKNEFNKGMLEAYGRNEAQPAGEEAPFPLNLGFARGFERTIHIKGLADVLLKDVGGMRAKDGRWPLVIDPSGRSSTFIQYTGAAVFHMPDLRDMDSLRLRRALLNGLLKGGCILVDLGAFDFGSEVIEEPWNNVERGLFRKLVDRSVLYSYLLPRRFLSLVTQEVKHDYDEYLFFDEKISNFVFGFVTRVHNPDWSFAKQFYTIRIMDPDGDDG